MNEFKKYLQIKVNWALAALLALLGFSCSETEEMYGAPYSQFEVDLEVTDEAGRAQANQEVIIRRWIYDIELGPEIYINPYFNDTVQTDINGKYSGAYESYGGTDGVRIVVKNPVDETLAADSVNVFSEQIGKGDGWFMGKFKASGRLILKKKK